MTMNVNALPLTDTRGRALVGAHIETEPEPASVVLTSGETGTAWQRWFSDGLWHSTRSGGGKTWEWMLAQRNVVLVYDAPVQIEGDQR
jgi:hypothetical protein